MSFYFQDDFYEACKELPKKQCDEAMIALLEYGMTGEEPNGLSGAPKAIFIAFRERIDLSKKRSEANSNNRKNKQRNANESETNKERNANENETKAERNANETQPHLLKRERENKKENKSEIKESALTSTKEKPSPSSLSIRCLDIFNRTFGTSYTTMPKRNVEFLNALPKPPNDDDIGAMLRFKRTEWGKDQRFKTNLTPQTLFSPDHFEQYMHQSKMQAEEVSEYAAYD